MVPSLPLAKEGQMIDDIITISALIAVLVGLVPAYDHALKWWIEHIKKWTGDE